MKNIHNLLSNPKWFPYKFSSDYKDITFVKTTSEQLRKAPFLDSRFLTKSNEMVSLKVKEISSAMLSPSKQLAFIFHSAFCCSTLFAGALDKPKKTLVLKEPEIMMSLANAKRMIIRNNRPNQDYKILINLVMRLLSRPFSPQESIVIKPTNSANNLIVDIHEKDIPYIFIHSNFEDFLISILKKGEACKSFIRTQFNIFSLDQSIMSQINPRQAMTLTDLQVAYFVWQHQINIFHNFSHQKLIIQDKYFLENKEKTLFLAIEALNLKNSKAEILKLISSDYFSKNIKSKDKALNAITREREANKLRLHYDREINATLVWSRNLDLKTN